MDGFLGQTVIIPTPSSKRSNNWGANALIARFTDDDLFIARRSSADTPVTPPGSPASCSRYSRAYEPDLTEMMMSVLKDINCQNLVLHNMRDSYLVELESMRLDFRRRRAKEGPPTSRRSQDYCTRVDGMLEFLDKMLDTFHTERQRQRESRT